MPTDRADIHRRMELVMGPLPGPERRVALDVAVEQTVDEPDRVRYLLTFATEPGDRCTAWLMVPKLSGVPGAGSSSRLPAMLCLHQTTGIGKDEPAGLGGLANLHYAAELTRRGYVTLAPDYPNFGGYRVDCYAMGYASATMKGIWNHLRAADLLASRPEVDPARMGVIGHSLGGHNTLFAAAYDPRLRVAVSSCGFTGFAWNDDEGRGKPGDLSDWSHRGYMPRIKDVYHCSAAELPWDFPDVLAAIAPRALFINGTKRDFMRFEGVVACVEGVAKLYEEAGVSQRLAWSYPDCAHDFPPDSREQAYAFIDRMMGR